MNCGIVMLMIAFDPGVHTPEAFVDQLTLLHETEPSAYVVGSIGRAVLFRRAVGNPNYEYAAHGQYPLNKTGDARDIDVVSLVSARGDIRRPFELDNGGFNNPIVHIARQGGKWVLGSEVNNFAELIHDDVMEPVEGTTIFDAECRTLPIDTQIALFGVHGPLRWKDSQNLSLLIGAADRTTQQRLPEELYAPFRQLGALNGGNTLNPRALYRRYVPDSVRRRLKPIASPISRAFYKAG